jgi:rhodanese-related sulfurtransferase
MKENYKKLFLEMAIIVIAAVVVGILWNFNFLRDAGTGKLSDAKQQAVISATDGKSMTPANLVQVKELFERKEAIFVDAREGSVFSGSHIKGALSLPLGTFESGLKTFRAAAPIDSLLVIYCSGYGCHDSKSLGEKLMVDGYRRILIYEGGYPEWKDAGLPIEGAAP